MGPRKNEGRYWGYKEQGNVSYKASRVFNVPQTTLWYYVKNRQKRSSETVKTKLGRKQVLPCEEKKIIWLNTVFWWTEPFFGLTIADVMRLTNKLAVRNRIKNEFCKRNEKAGRKWLKNFLRRHPQISVRTPEGLSQSRARDFTPESVAQFFKSTNLQWTPLNIILQVFTIAMKPPSLWYSTNTRIY